MPRNKGSKDTKPRKRNNADQMAIEKRMKEMKADTDALSDFTEYITYRNKILKKLMKKPAYFMDYINPALHRMEEEGVVYRVGRYFQITEKGKRDVKD